MGIFTLAGRILIRKPANLIRTAVKLQFSPPQIDELDNKAFEFQLCGILPFNHYHCSAFSIQIKGRSIKTKTLLSFVLYYKPPRYNSRIKYGNVFFNIVLNQIHRINRTVFILCLHLIIDLICNIRKYFQYLGPLVAISSVNRFQILSSFITLSVHLR